MGKIKVGNCPRCKNGELFIDRDLYGWFECCLQCGYNRDMPELIRPVEGKNVEEKEKTLKLKVKSSAVRKGA